MIVVEGNSLKHPCSKLDLNGHKVITAKVPTENTDYLFARDINWRHGYDHIDFMCYKWMTPTKGRVMRLDDVWQADYKYWDKYFGEFSTKEPSVGTCAIFSVVERWNPKEIGLIGFDWVLDTNSDWFHDAVAEKKAIEQLVKIIDLRKYHDTDLCRI